MTVVHSWLDLLRFIKSTDHDHVVITLTAPEEKYQIDSFPRGVPADQFHNRSPSATEDIGIFEGIGISFHRVTYVSFSPMESSPKAMIISCSRPVSGFKLKIWCPVAKMPWKNVGHHVWWTKKMLVSQIRTWKCFGRRFALSDLLIVFHCIISLLIVFYFIALLIGFSK